MFAKDLYFYKFSKLQTLQQLCTWEVKFVVKSYSMQLADYDEFSHWSSWYEGKMTKSPVHILYIKHDLDKV